MTTWCLTHREHWRWAIITRDASLYGDWPYKHHKVCLIVSKSEHSITCLVWKFMNNRSHHHTYETRLLFVVTKFPPAYLIELLRLKVHRRTFPTVVYMFDFFS
jgi:hypothetical protein